MARTPAARSIPKPRKSPADTRRILTKLYAQHPDADTELHYTNPYELLVATILSAQCTDERVNQVTPALFKRYPNPSTLATATTSELEPQIQSTGFFRAKSRSLVGMANAVVSRHAGEIPRTMTELTALPGVGRKTANVVLGHALGVPGLPVDRHVLRVANRIGIARSEDPGIVEQQLNAALPPEDWTRTSDTLILHGRRICKPRPLCDRCAVRADCEYYQSILGAVPRSKLVPRREPRGTGRGGGAFAKAPASLAEAKRSREAPQNRGESGKPIEVRRAAKPRGTGRGGATFAKAPASLAEAKRRRGAPENRGESGKPIEVRRAAKPRGTGRGGATFAKAPASLAEAKRSREAPENRGESGKPIEVRRAAKPRGTGGGGGAPPRRKQ